MHARAEEHRVGAAGRARASRSAEAYRPPVRAINSMVPRPESQAADRRSQFSRPLSHRSTIPSVGAIMSLLSRVGVLLMAPAAALSAQQVVDYHKADLIRVAGAYVLGAEVRPVWMSDSVRFYYKSSGSK